jgi:hypothetical protein
VTNSLAQQRGEHLAAQQEPGDEAPQRQEQEECARPKAATSAPTTMATSAITMLSIESSTSRAPRVHLARPIMAHP